MRYTARPSDVPPQRASSRSRVVATSARRPRGDQSPDSDPDGKRSGSGVSSLAGRDAAAACELPGRFGRRARSFPGNPAWAARGARGAARFPVSGHWHARHTHGPIETPSTRAKSSWVSSPHCRQWTAFCRYPLPYPLRPSPQDLFPSGVGSGVPIAIRSFSPTIRLPLAHPRQPLPATHTAGPLPGARGERHPPPGAERRVGYPTPHLPRHLHPGVDRVRRVGIPRIGGRLLGLPRAHSSPAGSIPFFA